MGIGYIKTNDKPLNYMLMLNDEPLQIPKFLMKHCINEKLVWDKIKEMQWTTYTCYHKNIEQALVLWDVRSLTEMIDFFDSLLVACKLKGDKI